MVYCSYCGIENEDNATFCQNCGTRIKPEDEKSGIRKLINWKAILVGGMLWLVLVIILLSVYTLLESNNTTLLGFSVCFVQIISGIVVGYISGKEYSAGILNVIVLGIFFAIIIGIGEGLDTIWQHCCF
jgi:VIT1/CCC1 family predicted Fe2+/Mn2+ transporter